jgi:hypothetical protein
MDEGLVTSLSQARRVAGGSPLHGCCVLAKARRDVIEGEVAEVVKGELVAAC